MNKNLIHGKLGVSGHFKIQRIAADTGEIRQELEFENLITDTGLDQMFTAPTFAYGFGYWMGACAVGSGNTAPANTDTALAALVATAGGLYGADSVQSKSYVAGPPAYWSVVNKYRFGTGVAAGNLSEVGIYPTNGSATALGARALIVDGSNNPTTITVLADEILDVTYERRFHLDTSDTVGTFTADGVIYDTVLRLMDIDNVPSLERANKQNSDGNACAIYAYSGALQSVTLAPLGAGVSKNASFAAYVNGNRYVDVTATFDVADANYANGIQALAIYGCQHKFQMSFLQQADNTKGIMKTTGQKLTVTFRLSIARYP